MVRFIILGEYNTNISINRFTFQYGQIYYLSTLNEIDKNNEFTFQYGQIYYKIQSKKNTI